MSTINKPKGDQTLPSGATIHWDKRDPKNPVRRLTTYRCGHQRFAQPGGLKDGTGLCFDCANAIKITDEERHPTGATIHWGEREPKNHKKVAFTCCQCGHKSFTSTSQVKNPNWSGLCPKCYWPEKHIKDEPVPRSGSTIHWSEHKGELVPVTCGWCKERHKVSSTSARGSGFLGYHRECYFKVITQSGDIHIGKHGSIYHADKPHPTDPNKRLVTCSKGKCDEQYYMPVKYGTELLARSGLCPKCRPQRRTGEIPLPKGSTALFDKPTNPPNKVLILCRGCKEEKVVCYGQVDQYLNAEEKEKGTGTWQELCSDCLASGKFKHPHTYDHVKEIKPFRSFIHWGVNHPDDDPNDPGRRNMVICGRCGHKNFLKRDSLTCLTKKTRKKKWSGCCRDISACGEREAVLREQEGERESQNGSKQGNDNGEKCKVGRKPITDAEHEQLVADIRRTVFMLRDQAVPRADITSNRVASELHIGSKDKGGDTMMRRLKKGGVKQKWPAYRDSILDGEGSVKLVANATA